NLDAFQYAYFPDYPKIGVWTDAYYATYNMFSGNSFQYAEACAMDRTSMLAGQAAAQQCFTPSSAYVSMLPSDLDGSAAPPAGEPDLLIGLGRSNTTLASWKFHVDWSTPANTTFTGPTTVTVAQYTMGCGGGGECVPQPSPGDPLDSLGDRIMYRLAYRNLGDHESFVVTHSVNAGPTMGIRWYELRYSEGN